MNDTGRGLALRGKYDIYALVLLERRINIGWVYRLAVFNVNGNRFYAEAFAEFRPSCATTSALFPLDKTFVTHASIAPVPEDMRVKTSPVFV